MPWTPTSRVIWLRALWMMCWSRERSKQSREEGGRTHVNHTHGRTRTHSNTHAHTHTPVRCFPQLRVQSVSPRDSDRETLNNTHTPLHLPHPIHTRAHTHTHTVRRTRVHTFLRGLEMTRLAEFEVYLRGYDYYSPLHTHAHTNHTLFSGEPQWSWGLIQCEGCSRWLCSVRF